jgi:hypothetical protein
MNHDSILFRDRTGGVWLLGSGFVMGGLLVMAMLAGLAEGRPTGWAAAAAAAISLAHITAGSWLILSHPSITVRLDIDGRRLYVVRRWLFIRRARELHVDQIMHAVVREDVDSDGDPVYHFELWLRTGERLVLQSVALYSRQPIDDALDRLARWSGNRIRIHNQRGAPLAPTRS